MIKIESIKRITKNISVYFVSQLFNYFFYFLFFVFAARYLGTRDFGVFSLALAVVSIFGILSDLGLRSVVTREVARDKRLTVKYLSNTVVLKFILLILTFLILGFFLMLTGYSEETKKVILLVSVSICFNAFLQLFYALFRAYERLEFEAFGSLMGGFFLLTGIIFVIKNKLAISELALIYSSVFLLMLIYALIISWSKFALPKAMFDFSFSVKTLKIALPFGLLGVFGMLLHWVDTVMLSILDSQSSVGIYGAAYRLFFSLLLIPAAFDMAVFPAMSRFHIKSKSSLIISEKKCFRYLAMIGLPIAIGGTLLADRLVMFFYTAEFIPAAFVLKILVWAAFLIFLGTAPSSLLNATDRQFVLAKIVGFALVLNVLLNSVLIPRFSYDGAAWATAAADVLVLIAVLMVTNKYGYVLNLIKDSKQFLKIVFSGVIMGSYIFYFIGMNLVLLILSSMAVYVGALFILQGIEKDDMNMVREIIGR